MPELRPGETPEQAAERRQRESERVEERVARISRPEELDRQLEQVPGAGDWLSLWGAGRPAAMQAGCRPWPSPCPPCAASFQRAPLLPTRLRPHPAPPN